MSTPQEKPKGRIDSLLDEEVVRVAEAPEQPRVVPDYVARHIQAAKQKCAEATVDLPAPPRWPMLSGIWTYPFYLTTLGPWMFMSMGLILFGWMFIFWIQYGAVLDSTSAYLIGVPTLTVGLLTLGYAVSCCFCIIEGTSSSWESFEVTPGSEWKEWIWNFAHFLALLLQAGAIGFVVKVASFSDSWLTTLAGTFAVFPLVLLGALAANGAWAPLAIGTVLRSLVPVWWAWCLFYLQTGVMIALWTLITKAGLGSPAYWLTPLYAGPLLATVIVIYARLAGRLAGCVVEATTKSTKKVDADEKL